MFNKACALAFAKEVSLVQQSTPGGGSSLSCSNPRFVTFELHLSEHSLLFEPVCTLQSFISSLSTVTLSVCRACPASSTPPPSCQAWPQA